MNLYQRLHKLSADWRSEIERRQNFLLPLGADLQSCLEELNKVLEVATFEEHSVSTRDDLEPEYPYETHKESSGSPLKKLFGIMKDEPYPGES